MKTNESINAIIFSVKNSTPVETPIRIGLGDHRIRFDAAHGNKIALDIVGNFAISQFLPYLYRLEKDGTGEITNYSAFLQLCIAKEETRLRIVVRYDVKHQTGKGRYTVEEKEKSFATDASRDLIVRYGDRYINYLRNCNSKKDADLLIGWYKEWAHPLTLEDVAATLTEDQKLIAAKLIRDYFAA